MLRILELKLAKAIMLLSLVLTLTGCLDSEWYGSTNGVRSKASRRISASDYSVGWEFKFTNKGTYEVSCRPRNVFSEFGLSFWTSLEFVGSEGDVKAFQGYRWRQPITLLLTPDGQAKILESKDGDTLVYGLKTKTGDYIRDRIGGEDEAARNFTLVYKHN
jgi:hypothetical protein